MMRSKARVLRYWLFCRLMKLVGIVAIYQAPRTLDLHPEHRIFPYLLKGLEITEPNHVWCADITYILVNHAFLDLVAIMNTP